MVMRVEKRERLPTIDTLLRIAGALEIDLSAVLKKAIGSVKRGSPAEGD
jgi:transcriptional regulator with XRE-family HTH domain